MPCKRMLSEEELWKQEVDNAVKEVKSGKYSNFREAARLTGLSKQRSANGMTVDPCVAKYMKRTRNWHIPRKMSWHALPNLRQLLVNHCYQRHYVKWGME